MSGRSLDQQRAAHALKCIGKLENDREASEKYASYVKALPAAIISNGLGQALATELAAARDKGAKKAHKVLVDHVARWLLSSPGRPKGWDLPKETHSNDNEKTAVAKKLLNCIVEGDQRAYVWAQAEAIAYVGWLKKLAVAFLSEDAKSSSDEGAASDGA